MAFQQFPQKGGIPSGNTAGRPSGAVIGDTYYNGQLSLLEIYDGTNWVPSSAPAGIPTVTTTDVGTGRAYTSGAVNFSFVAGVNGGTPYGFNGVAVLGGVTYTTGNTTASTATLAVGVAGTYSVSGTAYNGFGASPSSVAGNLVVTTVPEAPTIGTATTSSITTDVVVTWTLGNSGGKNLSSITITPYLNGTTAQTSANAATTSSTSYTFTGLTAGSAYTFKVKATNANGVGLESNASNSITVPTIRTIEYLVVAGGGGGGGRTVGGGGGAGGMLTGSFAIAINNTITCNVGAGGSGSASPNTGGATSSITSSTITTIAATGGGAGGNYSGSGLFMVGQNGGSGGGGGDSNQSGGTGISGQGNNGGSSSGTTWAGGGGGGKGAVGSGGSSPNGGAGGAGASSSITGSAVTYAGGGGGCGDSSGGAGGSGGGGNGGFGAAGTGTAGGTNLGGGGGGSRDNNTGLGYNGGSGVVIVRATSAAASTTGSPSVATSGGYTIYTFTGTGTITY